MHEHDRIDAPHSAPPGPPAGAAPLTDVSTSAADSAAPPASRSVSDSPAPAAGPVDGTRPDDAAEVADEADEANARAHGFTLLDPVESSDEQETVIAPSPRGSVQELPRRRGAEQTGETGIFTERPAFDRADLAPISDDLPELRSPRHDSGWQYVTGRRPHSLRRILLGRVLPVALLLGVTVWSWRLLREVEGRTGPTKSAAGDDRGTTAGSAPEAEVPSADTAAVDPGDDTIDATKIPRVLASFAENVGADGEIGNISVRQAIEPRRVTVVNLWATWCVPCKKELPEFARMFAEHRWGADVRFVPLLVTDPVDTRVAHREAAPLMPPFRHFLVDRGLDANPLTAIVAAKLLPEAFDLPVTLLIDCQRRVRKVYRRALATPEEFAELAGEIKRLRRELGTSRCNKPTPTELPDLAVPPVQTPTAPPQAAVLPPTKRKPEPITRRPAADDGPSCGDRFCDRKGGETCLCKQDCPCAQDESCQARDHDMVCLPAVKVEI